MNDLQPADFATADYRSVLRRLTTLDEDAARLRVEAVRWHDGRVAAADEAVQTAEAELQAAGKAVAAAQRDLERVEARAGGLWLDFVHKVGPKAERYGNLPQPAIPRQRDDRDPADYLDEVAQKVSYVPPARPLTSPVKILFGVFGFLGGVAGVLAYQLLRKTTAGPGGGDWKDAVPVLALLALLACPVLAVVASKRVADRRGVGLTAATVATVLVTGLVTAALFLAALKTQA
jgi:hypothetical protein